MRIPSKITAAERAARSGRVVGGDSNKARKGKRAKKASGVSASVSAKAKSLANEAGIDVEKVERLRELIENGEFVIDYQVIAERILQTG